MSIGTWTGKHPWMTFFLASSAIGATAAIARSAGGFGRLGNTCNPVPPSKMFPLGMDCGGPTMPIPIGLMPVSPITRPPTLSETVKEFLEQPACGYPLWQVLGVGAVGMVLVRGLTK